MKVLLSIKPEFVRAIFDGTKKFEYRKAIFAKPVTTVVVYSTKPVGMIVGEFTIKTILCGTPQQLWEKTFHNSGVTKEFLVRYFAGCKKGYAIQIENPILYNKPINPFTAFSSFVAPQSFQYYY